jgi:hypothetical protein
MILEKIKTLDEHLSSVFGVNSVSIIDRDGVDFQAGK